MPPSVYQLIDANESMDKYEKSPQEQQEALELALQDLIGAILFEKLHVHGHESSRFLQPLRGSKSEMTHVLWEKFGKQD